MDWAIIWIERIADDAVWFGLRVPLTNCDVQKIRLTLDLGAHGRWKQIDAVQLIGATPRRGGGGQLPALAAVDQGIEIQLLELFNHR